MKRLVIIFSIMLFAAFGFGIGSVQAEAASGTELNQLISEQKNIKNKVHEIAEIARSLGFPESHPIIKSAQKEWGEADKRQKQYNQELTAWKTKEREYPTAAKVWNYLKKQGLNDYVCAGIMGNLMAETGGQTLNINAYIYSNGYYGICQWSLYYCDVAGYTLDQQLEYLKNSMKREFNTFGFCYRSGFNYYSFTNMKNEREAALAFAKCYERCGSGSYYIRQQNATKAYKYFVG